ncbi:hypothetical protein BURPS305_4516 [Burkholderia pseudomallei 305]|nr:hypothetical protein BURPS305_4516 [Burkholderia pseudomallei 305]
MKYPTPRAAEVFVAEQLCLRFRQSGMRYDDKVEVFVPSGVGLHLHRRGLQV